jgi:hypothetical protein
VLGSFTNSLGGFPPQAALVVYGLTLEHMNRLTIGGRYIYGASTTGGDLNAIGVAAGIVNGPMTTIFQGTIQEAYPDGEMPNMGFFVRAMYGMTNLQLQKISPTSFNGSASIGTVMQAIASKANIGFENNNVNSVLSYPYFNGSARDQMRAAAAAAGAYIYFDPIKNTAAIWPKPSGTRKSSGVVVSPSTGLIGKTSTHGGLTFGHLKLHLDLHHLDGRDPIQQNFHPWRPDLWPPQTPPRFTPP